MSESTSSDDPLDEYFGPRVTVSDDEIHDRIECERVAFDLYKETTVLAHTAPYTYMSDAPETAAKPTWSRDIALRGGLLVRISKFMEAILQLTASGPRGDVVQALTRCVVESSVNLEYLCSMGDDSRFIESSLAPEVALYELIKANIEERGGEVQPIETRMRDSVLRTLEASGMRLEDVDKNYRDINFKDKLAALGKDHLYVGIGRISSHAVHGTWVDLLLKHIHWNGPETDTFSPSDWHDTDARLLVPPCIIVVDGVASYFQWRYKSDAGHLLRRAADLAERLERLDSIHERLLSEA